MMFVRFLAVLAMTLMSVLTSVAAEQASQSKLNPAKAQESKKYPQIVAYTVSWCPHCREAKEYLTHNNIPFINKDVEVDEKAMEELTGKYKSQGVPVIVFGTGKDEVIMKGFTPELFEESLKKARLKK
ncbi:MAG: NrdH-redoxin [Desulfuromonadaceae bacterium GWB2_53_15]|nr:MAG: NrdH-redoxin [Desulfuromonadaceae bacterium GWB2_53_15]